MEFQLLLSEFAIERLLYRLGVSPHADRFVLKGAMLFRLWSEGRRRATWDLDLLGRGANDVAEVVAVIRELCLILGSVAPSRRSPSVNTIDPPRLYRTAHRRAGLVAQ